MTQTSKRSTQARRLADFALRTSFTDLSPAILLTLKCHVLDTLGCAIAALGAAPVRAVREHVDELGGTPQCTLIGGGKSNLVAATLYNSVLVRYLDFMDNFLAEGETCHPSDNFGSILAAAEFANRSGRELLTALAVAYQVQCRLTEAAPIMRKGFD